MKLYQVLFEPDIFSIFLDSKKSQRGWIIVRLDKFLKVSRLIKRRTLAKEVTNAGRILLNGRVAKPGSKVKPGDILEIGLGSRQTKVEVLEVKDNVRANDAASLYKIME